MIYSSGSLADKKGGTPMHNLTRFTRKVEMVTAITRIAYVLRVVDCIYIYIYICIYIYIYSISVAVEA